MIKRITFSYRYENVMRLFFVFIGRRSRLFSSFTYNYCFKLLLFLLIILF